MQWASWEGRRRVATRSEQGRVGAGRRARTIRWGAALAVGAVLATACSALGLDESAPADPTLTTSAAAVADTTSAGSAVTIPTLATGTTSTRAAPTPWRSLISTSTVPTTTSQPPQTAPTTTRLTLTFHSGTAVTNPTVAAPTAMATPPPACYTKGTCSAVSSATSSAGTVDVVNPPGGSHTVAILTSSSGKPSAASLARVAKPTVACSGSRCLVQGSSSGIHFGSAVVAKGGLLTVASGAATSSGPLKLASSGGFVVSGSHRFSGYGVGPTDSPVATQTWVLSHGKLVSTGCGAPYLYHTPPAATVPQHGACSGTPRIKGYGSGSAGKLAQLGGFTSASGNIECALLPGPTLACTAKHHQFHVATCSKSVKKVPKALRGLRVLLHKTGTAHHDGCLGYTLVGSSMPTISYGRLAVGSGFVCEVTKAHAKCTAPSGHGFTLARAGLKTF